MRKTNNPIIKKLQRNYSKLQPGYFQRQREKGVKFPKTRRAEIVAGDGTNHNNYQAVTHDR